MARPAKKTEYRLMTLSEIREEANRRLYQANKLRAEYEAKARRKADEAAAWARRTGADIETGARHVQRQVEVGAQQAMRTGQAKARAVGAAIEREASRAQHGASRAAERAGRWTKSVGDDVRRGGATGARYADEAVDAVSAAPGRALEAIVDHWDDEIRDGRKYFLGFDPYRRAMLYRAHGVTDPNSAEAKAVEAAERDYLRQFYAKFHAEWDGEPDWKKPFRAFHYGAEKGGFGGVWAAARTLKRQDSWSDEGYQAELLPYTFAAEDHPVAYMAGEAVGGTARAMALRSKKLAEMGLDGVSDFADGYLSQTGDGLTRLTSGAANALGGLAAGKLTEGIESYVEKTLGAVRRRLIPAPGPAPRVSLPSASPAIAQASGPRVVEIQLPQPTFGLRARFAGTAEPGADYSLRFDPRDAAGRYGGDLNVPAPLAARYVLDRKAEALRPETWPTLGDHAYFLAPLAAEQATAAPVKVIADDLADEAAEAASAERLRRRETNAVRRRDAASK